MPRKTMIEAIRDAMDVMMERDDNVVVFGEDVGYLRRRVSLHAGPAGEIRQDPLLRYADQRIRHRRRGRRHGGLWAAPLRRNPVRRLHVSGLRPDRFRGRAAALPVQRAVHLPAGRAHADRRRHLRAARRTAKVPEALFTHVAASRRWCPRTRRRQRTADRGNRGPRSGDLPGAEAAVQRPVRRPPRPACDALVEARAWRSPGRPLRRAAWARPPSGARARR